MVSSPFFTIGVPAYNVENKPTYADSRRTAALFWLVRHFGVCKSANIIEKIRKAKNLIGKSRN